MSFQEAFSQQIHAFHTAIIDDCDRAARPDRSDAMVLRLRNNALALTKMQLAMLALTGAAPPAPEPETESVPWREPASSDPPAADPDRILAGDALSRFVSRPLGPDESPHEVWFNQLENEPAKRRRNPAIPGAGFRSSSG